MNMKKVLAFSLVLFLVAVISSTIFASEEATGNPIPTVPIVLDGKRMDPEEITRFDDQTLYYLVNDQAKAEGVIYVFTTLEKIEDFGAESQQQRKQQMSSCDPYVYFYTNSNYSGYSQFMIAGTSNSSLGPSLNNNINSVKTTEANMYTKLYENSWFSGNQLWLASCGNTPNLGIYGWNNRASSIKVN